MTSANGLPGDTVWRRPDVRSTELNDQIHSSGSGVINSPKILLWGH